MATKILTLKEVQTLVAAADYYQPNKKALAALTNYCNAKLAEIGRKVTFGKDVEVYGTFDPWINCATGRTRKEKVITVDFDGIVTKKIDPNVFCWFVREYLPKLDANGVFEHLKKYTHEYDKAM